MSSNEWVSEALKGMLSVMDSLKEILIAQEERLTIVEQRVKEISDKLDNKP